MKFRRAISQNCVRRAKSFFQVTYGFEYFNVKFNLTGKNRLSEALIALPCLADRPSMAVFNNRSLFHKHLSISLAP
jgi:hypothetical protein